MDTLPDDPSQQMTVIFHLIKDLQARPAHSAECQVDLSADLKAIKASQEKIETKILGIQKRLDALEAKMNVLGRFDLEVAGLQGTVEMLTAQHDSLFARVDNLEDRSRQNNLIFYGLTDTRETWEQSELIKKVLAGVVNVLADEAIERAHQLGAFSPEKCRPIIVKFSNHKFKERILSMHKK